MIVELNTDLSEAEKSLLKDYRDVDIKLFVDTDHLLHDGVSEQTKAENPNRIISVDTFYLLEEKDELGTWYMGQREKGKYVFWANYGDLDTTLKAL